MVKTTRQWLVAAIVFCFILLMRGFQEHRAIFPSCIDETGVVPVQQQSILVRESSFVYAGREYRFQYSTKLFSEAKDRTVAVSSLKNGMNSTTLTATSLPTVVYGVSSFGPDTARRDLIRKTWGSMGSQVFFMIANPPNDKSGNASAMIMDEFNDHGDLVWVDIPESYRNALTPKTFVFQHFTNHHYLSRMDDGSRVVIDPSGNSATKVDYIFKTDDDVFVNTTEMSLGLEAKGRPEYYGLKAGKRQINRDSGKFVTPWEEYPRDHFPPYPGGWGYAMSTTSAFFSYQHPIHTPTTGMSHTTLSNILATDNAKANMSETIFDYPLPPMVSPDKLAQISAYPESMPLSCTEQVMASMMPMPWEDTACGLLAEACQVPVVDDAYCEWKPEHPEPYIEGGSEVPVKLLHDVEPQWFEALMNGDPLEIRDRKTYKTMKKLRKKCRKVDRE